ncbi:PREDICTED: protein COFACTOR ASSEMBLY OF COMPLEX C SUBUNIT B CCB3, chloroplastic [Ipomoea nil]|uniref:protein COFACTOR ASSEMBLY OF COMPLEX C SUBUNIT B CCB3, chloroplastic n=1 Tax=Ipomoea nil TaxID=35883 RepID=UPI000900F6D9|nr:PREDICTED: protein COFACTOR ASSEMBLY OF COMPLEX C SUBUNIT B CCB3, chloroplastic [Ipomoea nil]
MLVGTATFTVHIANVQSGALVTKQRYRFLERFHIKRASQRWRRTQFKTSCSLEDSVPRGVEFMNPHANYCFNLHEPPSVLADAASTLIQRLVLLDLDPATAKLAITFLGPVLSAFSFLFILRIVMSWYPRLPVGKFPYVIAYAPTEPILIATRKVIPPLGGVDVTPVVWFGLVSFINEILLGPQGLLVLLSQQVSS